MNENHKENIMSITIENRCAMDAGNCNFCTDLHNVHKKDIFEITGDIVLVRFCKKCAAILIVKLNEMLKV